MFSIDVDGDHDLDLVLDDGLLLNDGTGHLVDATGSNLTHHGFWRALTSARKSGNLPRKQR